MYKYKLYMCIHFSAIAIVLLHVFRKSKESVNKNKVSRDRRREFKRLLMKEQRGGDVHHKTFTKCVSSSVHTYIGTESIFEPAYCSLHRFEATRRRSAVICTMLGMVKQHFLFGRGVGHFSWSIEEKTELV